jgi:hypothetical protein
MQNNILRFIILKSSHLSHYMLKLLSIIEVYKKAQINSSVDPRIGFFGICGMFHK